MSHEINDSITTWNVNGKEFHFDVYDAEQNEMFENAIEILRKSENFPRVGKQSEIIRKYCSLFREFFDNIFGKDSHKDIGIVDNVRVCNRIYLDFLEFVNRQKDEEANILSNSSISSANRQQRRISAKGKK
ncbi:MAG: hypothetical protein IKP95_09390 [Ruminococcus sp.]|nr:hypothetical protein [Ruminococcus sp.]